MVYVVINTTSTIRSALPQTSDRIGENLLEGGGHFGKKKKKKKKNCMDRIGIVRSVCGFYVEFVIA